VFIGGFAATLHSFYTVLSGTCSGTPCCSSVRLADDVGTVGGALGAFNEWLTMFDRFDNRPARPSPEPREPGAPGPRTRIFQLGGPMLALTATLLRGAIRGRDDSREIPRGRIVGRFDYRRLCRFTGTRATFEAPTTRPDAS
jgi:hypothetical protein